MESFPLVSPYVTAPPPPPSVTEHVPLRSNHYVKIWHVLLGRANNTHPVSWWGVGGGGGGVAKTIYTNVADHSVPCTGSW